MSDQSYLLENEFDLREMLAVLTSHKVLISLVTTLCIFIGGFYLIITTPKFTAKSIFKIERDDRSSFNLSSELGALASLAGFNSEETSESSALLERLVSRELIIVMSDKYSLFSDPFFNTYNPDYREPFWKSAIKKLIGQNETTAEIDAIIEDRVITNYKKFVEIVETDSGAISLSVTHKDPILSAQYANAFMEEIRYLVETETEKSQEQKLSYLSETLADALQEMDSAQQNLKDYALQNSARAQENFISGSLKLDELRMEKRKVQEIAEVLGVISTITETGNPGNSSYRTLQKNYPLVDDVDFRRILGMSETISAWTWPDLEMIEAVRLTLKDRINRLDIEVKNIENNAKIYAKSADDLVKFTRDARIAEATYTVLIEQVKSQSLAAGFQPNTFKVFEYATPPLKPTSPKKYIIVAVSTFLGIFLGSCFAIINSRRTGIYYTETSIIADTKADLILNSWSFRKLSKNPISEIKAFLSKNRVTEIDQAAVKLSNKKLIFVLNCGGRLTASGVARILATKSSETGRKVILCDKSGNSEKELVGLDSDQPSGLNVITIGDFISVMKGDSEALSFTSPSFDSTIKNLLTEFDQIFLCSSDSEGMLGLLAIENFKPTVILLASLRKTRRKEIKNVNADLNIDILFYD